MFKKKKKHLFFLIFFVIFFIIYFVIIYNGGFENISFATTISSSSSNWFCIQISSSCNILKCYFIINSKYVILLILYFLSLYFLNLFSFRIPIVIVFTPYQNLLSSNYALTQDQSIIYWALFLKLNVWILSASILITSKSHLNWNKEYTLTIVPQSLKYSFRSSSVVFSSKFLTNIDYKSISFN